MMADNQSASWQARYEQCLAFVKRVSAAVESGASIPLGPTPEPLIPPALSRPAPATPVKVVYCAPHPDDESLGGALAVRLEREAGASVTNVAITLGSKAGEKPRRLRELESACRALNFKLVVPLGPSGFDQVYARTREGDPHVWARKVDALREIFDSERPDMVFAPHAEDFNTTHIGTHYLAADALGAHLERSGRGPVFFIECEFWHQLFQPNLMVGVSQETVAYELVAILEHGDEMRRNPYHLLHACRMLDNIRRGSEVVGGQGAAAQRFPFAELYRVRFMKGREIVDASPGGRILAPAEPVSIEWFREKFGTGK